LVSERQPNLQRLAIALGIMSDRTLVIELFGWGAHLETKANELIDNVGFRNLNPTY